MACRRRKVLVVNGVRVGVEVGGTFTDWVLARGDQLGRDILSRVLYGARLSIPVGIGAVALAMLLGVLTGSPAGFLGGVVDEAIVRATDLMLAFPTIILAMVITAALGAGIRNATIAIMIAWWPTHARYVRGLVLSLRERE
jgi:peptide/nickel transport system permease protein